mmetsp:Transcript_4006/g.9646  ORF Transcript_4006/g.9646 Transcript_4006/m.9646 type:complete len:169 (+) Transcript_4006:321-827(+)
MDCDVNPSATNAPVPWLWLLYSDPLLQAGANSVNKHSVSAAVCVCIVYYYSWNFGCNPCSLFGWAKKKIGAKPIGRTKLNSTQLNSIQLDATFQVRSTTRMYGTERNGMQRNGMQRNGVLMFSSTFSSSCLSLRQVFLVEKSNGSARKEAHPERPVAYTYEVIMLGFT